MALLDRIKDNRLVGVAQQFWKRAKADAADQFGASIGFFAFVSLIPLIAIAVSVTALVLGDDPDRVRQVVADLQQSIPGLGTSEGLQGAIDGVIDNGGSIGLIGGITLLIAGMRVTNAAQTATRFVFDLPLVEAKAWKLRLWQLVSLLVLGVLALASVGVTSTAATLANSALGDQFGLGATIAAWVVGGLLDVALFWTAYRMYTFGGTFSWRDLLPGAIFGGLLWSLLKSFGTQYAAGQAANVQQQTGGGGASAGAATAGVIASIIGLLLLFYLAGRIYIFGAELSATLAGLPIGGDADRAGTSEQAAPDAGDGAVPVSTTGDTTPVDDDALVDRGPTPVDDGHGPRVDTTGSLADRFRQRGAVVDDSVTAATLDGSGTEVVPWQAPAATPLDDRRNRQAAAFATAALAVVVAGFLGRNT